LEVGGKGGFLLRPGEVVLARLPFSRKMLAVGLLVALPLLYLAQAYVGDLYRSLSSTEQEIRGLEVIRPAVGMVKELQRHRGTAARLLGGEAGARGELSEIRKKADEKAAEVRALLRERAELGLSDRWERISSSWQELASGVEGMDPRASFDAHTRLIEEILSFVSEVQDASGLTLDPELETYHLMVLVTDALPRLTEAMGQERAIGSGAAARGEVTAEERARLFALFGSARDKLGRLGSSTGRVFSRVPQHRRGWRLAPGRRRRR
jgi:methyl-accepting chemotaxis protein